MADAHLLFHDSVKPKIRAIIQRLVLELQIDAWTISFYVVPDEDLPVFKTRGTLACAQSSPEYLEAHIWIGKGALKHDLEATIIHELRHLHYSWVELVFRQAYDRRRKLPLADARRLLIDKIDELIERDIKIIRSK